MSDCNHDCSSCGQKGNCEEEIKKDVLIEGASVKHCIGVVSGKGGVGKSFVSSYISVAIARKGLRVGILDADVTGPSIPFSFGIKEKAGGSENVIYPCLSEKYNIQVMSSNLLLPDDTDPIIWRGPVIANLVDQFYSNVYWEDVDWMVVDMPPGTGDVPLTAFQKLPIEGIIIVTTPQSLVNLIVEKAVKMASMMNIPIIGLVENFSYVKCPHCDEKIEVFGKSDIENIAEKYNLKVLAKLPIDNQIATMVDEGLIEDVHVKELDTIIDEII